MAAILWTDQGGSTTLVRFQMTACLDTCAVHRAHITTDVLHCPSLSPRSVEPPGPEFVYACAFTSQHATGVYRIIVPCF